MVRSLRTKGKPALRVCRAEASAWVRLWDYCMAEFGDLDVRVVNRLRSLVADDQGVHMEAPDDWLFTDFVDTFLANVPCPPASAAAAAKIDTPGVTEEATPPQRPETILPSSPMGSADLARLLGENPDAVESFLRRYRKEFSDCYIENESPRVNEPRYLYRPADVWPALLAWRDGRRK
jgi:hypothetical protein